MKNLRIEKAAAIIAFLGAAGYLMRTVFHLTYHVIKILYGEAIIYGLLPCAIIAVYGIMLLLNKKERPVLTSIPTACIAVYTVVLMLVNSEGEEFNAVSYVGVGLVLLTSVIYILTCTGVIKTKAPAVVFNSLSTFLYTVMVLVSVFYYASAGEAFSTYYGYISSMAGLALYFIASLLETIAMGHMKKFNIATKANLS